MPIEVVIMLVMMRMSDRYEEKLRLKMKEVALAERLEKIERQGTDPSLAKLNMKSATSLNQELQAVMQQFSQMTQALQAVMRMLQDMTLTPIRNIR